MKKAVVILSIIVVILLLVIGVLCYGLIKSHSVANTIDAIVDVEQKDVEKEVNRNENGLPIDDKGLITDENYATRVRDGSRDYYKVVSESNAYMTTQYDDCSCQISLSVTKNKFGIKEGDYYIALDNEEIVEIEYFYVKDTEKVKDIYLLTRSGKLYKVSLSSIGLNDENIKAKKVDEGIYRMDTRLIHDTKVFYDWTAILVVKSDGTFYEITK